MHLPFMCGACLTSALVMLWLELEQSLYGAYVSSLMSLMSVMCLRSRCVVEH